MCLRWKVRGYAGGDSRETVDKLCLKTSAENFMIRTVCCNDSTSATIRPSLYFTAKSDCREPVWPLAKSWGPLETDEQVRFGGSYLFWKRYSLIVIARCSPRLPILQRLLSNCCRSPGSAPSGFRPIRDTAADDRANVANGDCPSGIRRVVHGSATENSGADRERIHIDDVARDAEIDGHGCDRPGTPDSKQGE